MDEFVEKSSKKACIRTSSGIALIAAKKGAEIDRVEFPYSIIVVEIEHSNAHKVCQYNFADSRTSQSEITSNLACESIERYTGRGVLASNTKGWVTASAGVKSGVPSTPCLLSCKVRARMVFQQLLGKGRKT